MVDALLALLLHANQLKRVLRTGWVMRGVPDAESVADHTFGVAFVALLLGELVEQPVDMGKLLAMALLHDLPEAVLSDIPAPARRYFSSNAKVDAEQAALSDLLQDMPWRDRWRLWHREYEKQSTLEARLVRDADHLDRLLQAHVYQRTTGNQSLDEFWTEIAQIPLEAEPSQLLLDALLQARGGVERG